MTIDKYYMHSETPHIIWEFRVPSFRGEDVVILCYDKNNRELKEAQTMTKADARKYWNEIADLRQGSCPVTSQMKRYKRKLYIE
tara:strand:+ start:165 stop:416 length:252 start_codon:yes stop_codon:yes gene_type:complete